jgi:hypothetical protein
MVGIQGQEVVGAGQDIIDDAADTIYVYLVIIC